MEHFELRCLCDYLGGAQAVNTWATPTPLAVGGELELDERGEIVYAEIWSPVTVLGVEEELRKVAIIVDGENISKYLSLSGIRATCMAPPKDRIWSGRLYAFGTPMSNDALFSTTIKYKQNVTVRTLAGPAVAITQPFRVRLWGYAYKKDELPRVFGAMIFRPIYDRARNRTIPLDKKNPIPVDADSWLTLPGGKDQAIPKINPFCRYAYNLLATNGLQGDYPLRFSVGNVADEDENMYWEFDEKDALLVEGLGCKPGVNMARTGLRIAGDYKPKGPTTATSLFPTTVGVNELNFGHLFPMAPVAHPYHAAIPKLARPYLIHNEIGEVIIRDDGTAAVAANATVVALTGMRLEMRS